MADIPICRNKDCPTYQSNKGVILASEGDTNWLFICKNCLGREYKTKPSGWKRARMENSYRAKGRPEYARERAIFDLGHKR
jgi:hypothetical protein